MLKKIIRYKIKDVRLKKMTKLTPLKIVIGAGGVFQQGWIPTDIEQLNIVKLEDWRRYFQPDSIDAMLAEHVWEHLSEAEAITAARNCYTYLKPGGYLRVAVPDGFHPSIDYVGGVKPQGNGPGADDHKVLYTYTTFTQVFEVVGFHVELLEYFGENGSFHNKKWYPGDGFVIRSMMFDERNRGGKLNYTSIIADAWKK